MKNNKKAAKEISLFNTSRHARKINVATLLTPQEVSERLRLKRATVWHYIREGKLKAIRFNKRTWRILEKDLNKFLKQCRR